MSGENTAHWIARMLRDEPVVQQGVRVLQSHCLGAGHIALRYGEQQEASARFARHVDEHYVDFARQALEAFVAVGFAAYRVRRLEHGETRIPELLPIGAFVWSVARGARAVSSGWETLVDGRMPVPPPRAEDHDEDRAPLLRYDVRTSFCKGPVHVYPFAPPPPMGGCASALAALVPAYRALCHKRECVQRADAFNSQPSLVFEQQDKTKINELLQSGTVIVGRGNESADRQGGEKLTLGGRQELHYELLHEFRAQSRLPDDTVTVIAPTNHAVHGLERVSTPMDLATAELAFARATAGALGVPEGLLLQGAHAAGAKTGGGGAAWSDGAEAGNRQLLAACRHLNRHLERLLAHVHDRIYPVSPTAPPRFRIAPVAPTVPLEPLLAAWTARLVDDETVSAVLDATWGAPLGRDAAIARAEQRKAEYDLPFRDKKETPKQKTKK